MDALVLPLFPITALLILKERRLGFLIAPFLLAFSIIACSSYMKTTYMLIDVYCVIAVVMSVLFFVNVKTRDPEQIPSTADSNGDVKIGT